MISTISAKVTNRLCIRSVGGRSRRFCFVRPFGGNVTDDSSSSNRTFHSPSGDYSSSNSNIIGYKRCRYKTSLRPPIVLPQIMNRSYSSSSKVGKDNNNDKSGADHHSFFQEQMLELEREQKQFGESDDDDDKAQASRNDGVSSASSNSSLTNATGLEKDLQDWKSEQLEVFGEALIDHDQSGPKIPNTDSSSSSSSSSSNDSTGPDLHPEEREDRFEFTPGDIVAWGKPNPEPEDMRTIIEQVALEREKEASYAEAASLSPPTENKVADGECQSTVPGQSSEHHESFSHVSGDGSSIHMVDVGHKAVTPREAHARSVVWLPPEVLEAFLPAATSGDFPGELVGPKGPIFATAKIAGIMASKKTSDLIPLCHPLPLDQVRLDIRLSEDRSDDGSGNVIIDCVCKVTHKTGVEMEALTGASVAALTIYDMTKAVSHNIRIRETRLIGKKGGKRTVLENTEPES